MITQVSALQLFILIGAAQGFILAGHIFLHYSKGSGNKLLAVGLFILSIRLLVYPFRNISENVGWVYTQDISLIALLLVGPLLFLFIRRKLNPSHKFTGFSFLHFIPFIVYFFHIFYPHFKLPACYSYATLYSGIFYGATGIGTINKWKILRSSKDLQYQLNSFAFPLLVIPASIYGLSYLDEQLFGLHPATFPYLLLTFLFYRMSFKSLENSKKFFNILLNTIEKVPILSPLHLEQLIEIVEKEHLYLDERMSVVDLAIRSGFSRHEVSQLINTGIGTSFNDFINKYRIDHVKKRLADPKSTHLSIVGIAQESGFRSKSTFHQVFKEMTGTTPGEYQKKHLK